MQNKKNYKYLILALVLLVSCCQLFLISTNSKTTNAAILNIDLQNELEDEYQLNSIINIPEGSFTFNNTDYNAVSVLYFPNGIAYSDSSLTLNVPGRYKLEYSAIINDAKVTDYYYFQVADLLYGATSDYGIETIKSSIEYTTHTNSLKTQNGIEVALSKNETFYYREPINFVGKTAEDDIIKLFLNPINKGTEDATKFNITFTDKYDSSNFITITAKTLGSNSSLRDSTCYFTANSSKQLPSGLEPWSNTSLIYEGKRYKLHQGNSYGTPVKISLTGTPTMGEVGNEYVIVEMDYDARKIFINNGLTSTLIMDLNEDTFFDAPWEGFKTGEAYLTIAAEQYQASSFNMFITDIDNQDISNNRYVDIAKPQLKIDFGSYDENILPNAIINKPYPLFNATAFDLEDGNIDVNTIVYYAYNSSSKVLVDIKDEKFTPSYKGYYTIIYTATDKAGNIETKEVIVFAENTNIELSLALGEKVVTGKAGSLLNVATPVVTSYFSKTNISIQAVSQLDGEKYDISEDLTFRPLKSGNYTINYVYSDFIEQKVANYIVEISSGVEPAILDKVNLPKYFIKSATYELPVVTGYEFSTGIPKEIPTRIVITEDNNTPMILEGNKYIAGNGDKVSIAYEAVQGDSIARMQYPDITLVDVGFKDSIEMSKYFVDIDNVFTATEESNSISFTTIQKGTLEFVNSLLATDFSLNFAVDKINNNYDTINVYLTDAKNSDIQLKLSYNKILNLNSKVNFILNGDDSIQVNASFYTGSSIITGFNNENRTITISNQNIIVETDFNGNVFNGFPSNQVNVAIEIDNVKDTSKIIINKINNQSFFSNNFDGIEPQITTIPLNGDRQLGDIALIKAAYVGDVLDTFTQFTMTVKAPDGSIVVSNDGTTLNDKANPSRNYFITLNQFGIYNISFTATDSSNNVGQYSYIIRVLDNINPVIILGEKQTTAKLNESITIASFSVSDNVSENIVVQKFIRFPNYRIQGIQNDTFKANSKGTYTILYYVYDEAGNTEIISYDISVS